MDSSKHATHHKLKKNRQFSTSCNSNKYTFTDKNPGFSSYLAGLIEADGSFAVHDKNSKAKKYTPKIIIVFSLSDQPLAEKLVSAIQVGKIYKRENYLDKNI